MLKMANYKSKRTGKDVAWLECPEDKPKGVSKGFRPIDILYLVGLDQAMLKAEAEASLAQINPQPVAGPPPLPGAAVATKYWVAYSVNGELQQHPNVVTESEIREMSQKFDTVMVAPTDGSGPWDQPSQYGIKTEVDNVSPGSNNKTAPPPPPKPAKASSNGKGDSSVIERIKAARK